MAHAHGAQAPSQAPPATVAFAATSPSADSGSPQSAASGPSTCASDVPSGASTAAAESPVGDGGAAERRVAELLSEIEQLSTQLSRVGLLAAAERLGAVAASWKALGDDGDDWPLQPQHLSFAGQLPDAANAGGRDEGSGEGSVGSVDGGRDAGDDQAGEEDSEEPQRDGVDPRAEDIGMFDLEVAWPGGPLISDASSGGFGGSAAAGNGAPEVRAW